MLAKQWFGRAWHLGRLIERDPARPSQYDQRARCYAELGKWELAAADYAKAKSLNVRDPEADYKRALLCLATGDIAGYRAISGTLLAGLGKIEDPDSLNLAVWTCTLSRDAVPDFAPLVGAGEQLLASNRGSYAALNTLGAVCCRAGRFDDAVRQLTAAVHADRDEGSAWDWLLLAMSHHQLRHTDESRRWLDKAVRWIERETNEKTRGTLGARLTWEQRLELALLRHEAESAITASAP